MSDFDPSRCENICDGCGDINPVWFAPSALWNMVIGGPQAQGDPGGFYCPNCFIDIAQKIGVRPTAWRLSRENEDDAWMCISTAPLDRPILAWWPHLERPVIAWISRGGASIGKWTFASFKFEHQTPVVAPTHWAELPAPPAIATEARRAGTENTGSVHEGAGPKDIAQ